MKENEEMWNFQNNRNVIGALSMARLNKTQIKQSKEGKF